MNQRWRDRLDSYRAPDEVITPSRYEVAALADDTTAKAFVRQHHYTSSYPAARFRFGLYRGGALQGVAVFSHPMLDAVLTDVFPGVATDSVELGRFVLLDAVPGNGESWFLARCFAQLRRTTDLRGVVSHSDPLPRVDPVTGACITPGHVGTIYQAFNGVYLGRRPANTQHVFVTGQTFSRRAQQKIRAGEPGWRYSAALLERAGAPPCPTDDAARRAWLRAWLPQLTQTVRHPGNHRYAWPLQKRVTLRGTPQPYPKQTFTRAGTAHTGA